MSNRAKLFIGVTATLGMWALANALWHWQSVDPARFACYLLVAVLASSLKIQLPGLDGTMSVNFLFILLSILELNLPETLVLGCTATLAQCLFGTRQKRVPLKILFNVFSMMANAIVLSYLAYHSLQRVLGAGTLPLLVITSLIFFLANTIPVAVIISVTENKPAHKVWAECHFWSFPFYMVGAAVVFAVGFLSKKVGWQTSLLILPLVYWVYRSYHLYLAKLAAEKKQVEIEKKHAENVAALHLRTIESLALAIEAKDHTSHQHLQRVRVFAVEVAKELNLPENEIEALRAAALLHDIGKLAIPEHIINKPGRLTPEEFEKMKIHTLVGAEILQRVAFPYPVAPIVRSHHEHWDGGGYPDGLKGEEIPRGARVLAAVDCLDALASHRQYRGAMSLDAAMDKVASMSGSSFDPLVVEVLQRRYHDLERMAQSDSATLSTAVSIPADDVAPTTAEPRTKTMGEPVGEFEQPAPSFSSSNETDFLSSIASARQEAQTMFELSQDLGNSLSLGETLSVLSVRLRKMIPYDSLVVFLLKENRLLPELVSGDNFRLLSSLNVGLGEGLCGWVAEKRKPIINENPEAEAGYVSDPARFTTLRSVLAVPLEGLHGVVGVLAMYRSEPEAFSADHLRILLAVSSKIALSVENALKYQQAEDSATTDYLTGLPNARSLFVHLSRELARCRRTGTTLAVMVCDLDNFKQINDLYGHLEGDNLLKDFANRVQEVCRGYDYVARMGGDEFVVVAPGLSAEASDEKASRLHQVAIEAGRKVAGRDLVGLSVGTAFCPEDSFDVERLLAEADRRMYSMKKVHHSDPATERDTSVPPSRVRGATVN
ncbi:MAG TPA: HD domain-containing phosphohydrolase [Terriglobales bacterium]|jgi:diguanylate cyclase (GGDEF)-like protein/putative nucleotidyltransferase with HDIG domain|nr:HD domain-containing phosphohydrolase [Terriglobales bacterium]